MQIRQGGLVSTPIKMLNKRQQLLNPADNRRLKAAIRSLNSPDLFPDFSCGSARDETEAGLLSPRSPKWSDTKPALCPALYGG